MDQVTNALYCSVYGQVHYCRHRGEFWIDFGDLQVWICQEQLHQLSQQINQLIRVYNPLVQLPLSRQFDLHPPGCRGKCHRLFADELLDLQMLIDGSLVMCELYQFLEDNQFRLADSLQ
jgi:hypothetical protein